jgi:hypothetical protein
VDGIQDEQEVREFIRERARGIGTLSWEELDRYGQHTVSRPGFHGDSGRSKSPSNPGWLIGAQHPCCAKAPRVCGTVFSPNPAGRLVRQSPIGVVRRRRPALLASGSPTPETAASVESRARTDEWFSS